jgi:CRP-like cAMP-binding protein
VNVSSARVGRNWFARYGYASGPTEPRLLGIHILVNHSIRPGATGNLFLDALPAATAQRLVPMLSRMHLPRAEVLAQAGVEFEHLYFPIHCLISTITRMADGSAVEVGIAGHEGFSSMSLAFGSRISAHTTLVQIADSSYRMSAEAFSAEIRADSDLRERVLAYGQYAFTAATQFAACNRLHPVEERYARWLLMADDRVGSDEFALTQEYSAQMLGVRRASVTVVAGTMSQAGLIAYRRGRITVLDRDKLEAASCECYAAANDELERLMGYDVRRRRRSERDGRVNGRLRIP